MDAGLVLAIRMLGESFARNAFQGHALPGIGSSRRLTGRVVASRLLWHFL
jgi:hypothetical protein